MHAFGKLEDHFKARSLDPKRIYSNPDRTTRGMGNGWFEGWEDSHRLPRFAAS